MILKNDFINLKVAPQTQNFFNEKNLKNKKIIFFDLDDTLYFRRDAFLIACKNFFDIKDCALLEMLCERCRIRGDEVFYQSQRGEITMNEMYIYRFQKGFEDCKIKITESQALDFEKFYKNELYNLKISNEVKNVLLAARQAFDGVGIITNGPKVHQWNKIKNLGLRDFVDNDLVIVSGEVGFDKPDEKIFKIAENRAENFLSLENNKTEFFIVGDSFCNDILPSKKIGWKTIWLNLYNEELNFEKKQNADFIISSINELQNELENELNCN